LSRAAAAVTPNRRPRVVDYIPGALCRRHL